MVIERLKTVGSSISEKYRLGATAAYGFAVTHPQLVIAGLGAAIVLSGAIEQAFAADGFGAAGGGSPAGASAGSGGGSVSGAASGSGGGSRTGALGAAGGASISGNAIQACSRNIGYLEGGFGTLVASAAGLGAIIAAALGGFKAAWALFVVSVGCFILRTYLTLFLTGC